jgi:hypothetical protein
MININNENNVERCYELYEQETGEINSRIENEFEYSNFVIRLPGSVSESDSEEIEKIELINPVNIINAELINLEDLDIDQIRVTFELLVEVDYEAHISYRDLEYASYDREDDRWFNAQTINRVASESCRFPVEVQLEISRDENGYLYNPSIINIDINPRGDLDRIIISRFLEDEDTM